MKKIIRMVDVVSSVGGGLAGIMLCGGLALILTEIVLRGVFSKTLFITEEYSGYLMSALTFCALGYTLREKGHIRMTFLHRWFSGKPRVILDILCYAVGFVFCAGLTCFTGELFWDSVATGSQSMQISETYLAIPQFFMPLGALIMTLQFLGEMLKSIFVLMGDTEGLSIQQEMEDLGR